MIRGAGGVDRSEVLHFIVFQKYGAAYSTLTSSPASMREAYSIAVDESGYLSMVTSWKCTNTNQKGSPVFLSFRGMSFTFSTLSPKR